MDIRVNELNEYNFKLSKRHKTKIKLKGNSSGKSFFPFMVSFKSFKNGVVTVHPFNKPKNTMRFVWSGDALDTSEENTANVKLSGGKIVCKAIQKNGLNKEFEHNEASMIIPLQTLVITDSKFIKVENQYMVNYKVYNPHNNSWSLNIIVEDEANPTDYIEEKKQIFTTFHVSETFEAKKITITITDNGEIVDIIESFVYYIGPEEFDDFELDLQKMDNRIVRATSNELSSTNSITYSWSGDGLDYSDGNEAHIQIFGGEIKCIATQTNDVTGESVTHEKSMTIVPPTININYQWNGEIHTNAIQKVYTDEIVSDDISGVVYTWSIDDVVQTGQTTHELTMPEYIHSLNKNQRRETKIDLHVIVTDNYGFEKHMSITSSSYIYPYLIFDNTILVYGNETSTQLQEIRYHLPYGMHSGDYTGGSTVGHTIALGTPVTGFTIPTPTGFDSNKILFNIDSSVADGTHEISIRMTNDYGYSAEETITITFERYIPFVNYPTSFLTQQADRIIRATTPTYSEGITWSITWIDTNGTDLSGSVQNSDIDIPHFFNILKLESPMTDYSINAVVTQTNTENDALLDVTQPNPLPVTRPTVQKTGQGFLNSRIVYIDLDVTATTSQMTTQWTVGSAKFDLNNGDYEYENYTLTQNRLSFQLDEYQSWQNNEFSIDVIDSFGFYSDLYQVTLELTIEHTVWFPSLTINVSSSATYVQSKNVFASTTNTIRYSWSVGGNTVSNVNNDIDNFTTIPLTYSSNTEIKLNTVITNEFGFSIQKEEQSVTIIYPTLSFSDLNLVHDSGNIYKLSYDAYTTQPVLDNKNSIEVNDYTISVISSSSSNLTYSSTDEANKKISLAITNLSVGTNTYTITVRITDSFNFSRDYVKNVSFSQFPTDSLIPQLSTNSSRQVSINPIDYGFGLSYSWMVNQNGSTINFDNGTTKTITISNGTYSMIYVKCIVTYTSSSSTGNVTKSFEREVTLNNNFGYSGSLSNDVNQARVNATAYSGSNTVNWYWTINNISNNNVVVTNNWTTNRYIDIPDSYRDSSLYYVKGWFQEFSPYGFIKEIYIQEINLPTAFVQIINVTSIHEGSRTYYIHVNSHNTVIDGSISGALRFQEDLLKYQFNEYETSDTKVCSVTVEDSRGFKGKDTYNLILSVTFAEYSPTIQFVVGKTRLIKIKDDRLSNDYSESYFEYVWSAGPGLTLDSSQVDKEFKNYVVQDSVAGTVYVDVTQINVEGFKKDYSSYSIDIQLPTLTFQLYSFTIVDNISFTDTVPSLTASFTDVGKRRVENSSGDIVTRYEIEDTYSLLARLKNDYNFRAWALVDTVSLNNPVIDMVNTIVRDTSIELHWTSEPAEELSASTFNITYTSSTTTNNVQATYPSHTITGLTAGTLYTVDVQKVYHNTVNNYNKQYRRSASNNITTSYIDTTGDYSSSGNIKLTLYLENGSAVYQHVFNHVMLNSKHLEDAYRNTDPFAISHDRPVNTISDNRTGPEWDYDSYQINIFRDIIQDTYPNPNTVIDGLQSKGLTLADIHSYTLVSTNNQIQPYMDVSTITSQIESSQSNPATEFFPPTNTVTSIQSIFPTITTGMAPSSGIFDPWYDSSAMIHIYVKQRCISWNTILEAQPGSQYYDTDLNFSIVWIRAHSANESYFFTSHYGVFESTEWEILNNSSNEDYLKKKINSRKTLKGDVAESEYWNSTIVRSFVGTSGSSKVNANTVWPIRALYWDDYKELATWNTNDPNEFEVKRFYNNGLGYDNSTAHHHYWKTHTIDDMYLPNSYV